MVVFYKQFGLLLCLGIVVANFGGGLSFAANTHPAQQLIEDTTQKLLSQFDSEQDLIEAKPEILRGIVADIILPHFDFVRMSKLALGKHWRRASVEQRKAFTVQFRELLVNTYSKAIYKYADQYDDVEIKFKPVRAAEADESVNVVSEVSTGEEPVEVAYRLYLKGDVWKVFDVTIEGVSLISNYRSTFSEFVQKHGIEALIADLERRNMASDDEPA